MGVLKKRYDIVEYDGKFWIMREWLLFGIYSITGQFTSEEGFETEEDAKQRLEEMLNPKDVIIYE